MSWDAAITIERPKTEVHDCPNCGGHTGMERVEIWEGNITYNVGRMLRRAGIHPGAMNGMEVHDALPILLNAIELMIDCRSYFESPVFEPANGWGSYVTTRDFLIGMSKAMEGSDDHAIVRWI